MNREELLKSKIRLQYTGYVNFQRPLESWSKISWEHVADYLCEENVVLYFS